MVEDEEIDITDIGRYGADPKRVKQLNKKRMKIEIIESDSSSEESSSSSSDSSENEESNSDAEPSAEVQSEEKHKVRQKLEQRIRQTAQEKTQITIDDGDEAEAELYNLKRVLDRAGEKLNKAGSSEIVDLDDEDDEDEEDEIEDSAPRIRYVDDEDESELEDAPQQVNNVEEDEEEEESEEEEDDEEAFTLTFKFKGSKFTVKVNPNQPMSDAFNAFLDRANVPEADRTRKIIYRFDGSALKANQPPVDQDLESEDQIDVEMK